MFCLHTVKYQKSFISNNSVEYKNTVESFRALSATIPLGRSQPESYDNEVVFRFPQSPSITGASLADCLVSNQGHSLGETYTSAEM